MPPRSNYSDGVHCALVKLGIDAEEAAQLGVATGVGATPFAGMIGRGKLRHDPLQNPNIKRYQSLEELQKVVRPGDVFVASGGPTGWRKRHQLMSGSPLYHGGIVMGTEKAPRVLPVNEYLSLFEDPAKANLRSLPGFAKGMKADKYPNLVVLRPEGGELSPQELKTLKAEVAARSRGGYSKNVSRNWLRELFLPKSRLLEQITEPVAAACEGGTCTTVPSQAHYVATGRSIGETAPRTTTPADLLSSKRLQPVGAHLTEPFLQRFGKRPWLQQAQRLGTRGAIGLGLGGLAYGTMEDPAPMIAGVGGAALAPRAFRAGLRRTLKSPEGPEAVTKAVRSMVPEVGTSNLNWFYHPKASKSGRLLRNLTRRTLPLALGGGLLGYLGTRELKERALGEDKPEGWLDALRERIARLTD